MPRCHHSFTSYFHYPSLTSASLFYLFFFFTILHPSFFSFFFFNDTAPPEIYTLPLPDALPIPNGPPRPGRASASCHARTVCDAAPPLAAPPPITPLIPCLAMKSSPRGLDFMAKHGIKGVIGGGAASGGAASQTVLAWQDALARPGRGGPLGIGRASGRGRV